MPLRRVVQFPCISTRCTVPVVLYIIAKHIIARCGFESTTFGISNVECPVLPRTMEDHTLKLFDMSCHYCRKVRFATACPSSNKQPIDFRCKMRNPISNARRVIRFGVKITQQLDRCIPSITEQCNQEEPSDTLIT